jgi:hypothetical protein
VQERTDQQWNQADVLMEVLKVVRGVVVAENLREVVMVGESTLRVALVRAKVVPPSGKAHSEARDNDDTKAVKGGIYEAGDTMERPVGE